MKIILTRDGLEKSKELQGFNFNDRAAIEFLANLIQNSETEEVTDNQVIN